MPSVSPPAHSTRGPRASQPFTEASSISCHSHFILSSRYRNTPRAMWIPFVYKVYIHKCKYMNLHVLPLNLSLSFKSRAGTIFACGLSFMSGSSLFVGRWYHQRQLLIYSYRHVSLVFSLIWRERRNSYEQLLDWIISFLCFFFWGGGRVQPVHPKSL